MEDIEISTRETRLRKLREELARRALTGFVIPSTDEHMSEYVAAYARRLAWLTGFEGSVGWAVVLDTEAAIFVDGRYTLQARSQVGTEHWKHESLPHSSVVSWLAGHARRGVRIGCDPWLHSKSWMTQAHAELSGKGAELVMVDSNPIDAVWSGQPAAPGAKLIIQPDDIAGMPSAEKRNQIAAWLESKHADVLVLTGLDSIAWTFNIRGRDVPRTPVARSFALVHADGSGDLFVDDHKLTAEIVEHLGTTVRLHSGNAFPAALEALTGRTVALDPERAAAAIFDLLKRTGVKVLEITDPVIPSKAIKNATEIAGHRNAQIRDGAAVTGFLHWFSVEAPKGALTELSAAAKLLEFRMATGELRDLSFDTISGFGPNAAIVHYRADEASCLPIEQGSLYLVDSGGQYADGTTDITRTVAVGSPTAEMRDRFTRVLKGHIALARAVFPEGTNGGQLDILARQYLFAAGLDYAHGTGHGVGTYLGVHEGPQRISNTGNCSAPLVPGMILSNEPGYYKAGQYGMRIENLMLVVERHVPGAERRMFGFEMLTFVPIDRTLIDLTLLTHEERAWVDEYHAEVARALGSRLEGTAKAWLIEATRALT